MLVYIIDHCPSFYWLLVADNRILTLATTLIEKAQYTVTPATYGAKVLTRLAACLSMRANVMELVWGIYG
ncbi:hypothetical protein NE897_00185 [Yersinia ruckeri]|uniref:Uncharacterized protein n=1 Tax=Yersinia ruckeri TaxID=29486 RepID=A0A0A8VGF0_YERRU|nr:hypothetical protein [Yersinia ruckeri]EEP99158.1 hypothetical protein yruck0001_14810 [Yersinia ruckeri ATCC 29473]EKN3344856.1 hypothetical protein [Yersinia ruckeri]EKN3360275.1 hypothetical protein [Yersinia ruckeri]EKN4200013.1 hypothetical protein [Yersinia ruckeri]EKN4206604.1 hypothetical protein [Yersinia ruckeri]